MTNQTSKWENCVTGKTWLQNHASHDAIECKAEVLFAELLNGQILNAAEYKEMIGDK